MGLLAVGLPIFDLDTGPVGEPTKPEIAVDYEIMIGAQPPTASLDLITVLSIIIVVVVVGSILGWGLAYLSQQEVRIKRKWLVDPLKAYRTRDAQGRFIKQEQRHERHQFQG